MNNTLKRYKLSELVEVTRGQSLIGEYYAEQGDVKRLTLANFDYQNGGFKEDLQKTDIYYTGIIKPQFLLNEDDIITPLTEQTPGLLGSTARIPESGKYIQSGDVALVKCNEDIIDPSFCYYLLPSSQVKKQLAAGSQQTKIRHTNPEAIKNCIVDIPCLEQQKNIGILLDTITAKIDENRKQNDLLEKMTKQIYDYWFVQYDFPNENGRPYKSSGGIMVYDEKLKREIPQGWDYARLIDIANITMGQSPEGSSYNENGDGIIFYQGSTDFGIRFPKVRMFTTAPSRYAKKGDILMSVRAPVGATNIASYDCCIGRGLSAINSKIGSITYIYEIISYFKSMFEQKNSAGTTFGSITKDELYGLPCIKPDQKVIDAFEKICSPIFEKQMQIGEETEKLKSLKDFLLPLLMTGQVHIN